MTTQQAIADDAQRKNLRLLMTLRGLAFCAQLAAILIAYNVFNIVLPVAFMVGVASVLALFNLYSLYRLRSASPVTRYDVILALVVDILVLTVQLHLSNGASNPFVAFYMLPVIIGAVMLDTATAWLMFGLTIVCYLALLALAPSYPGMDSMGGMAHKPIAGLIDRSNLHMMGMMIGYFLCAGCVVFIVTRIRGNLAVRDKELQDVRANAVERDHILRTGLLAAGAAHELGTPLTTLSIILRDWRQLAPPKRKADRDAELDTMSAQVERCKMIISDILTASGQARGEGATTTTVHDFLTTAVERWQGLHKITIKTDLRAYPDVIVADRVLEQSLFNLLDNALEASRAAGGTDVSLSAAIDDNHLRLTVGDHGKGFDPAVLASPGQPFQSTKAATSRGLGLFLVRNTVQSLGGKLEVASGPAGSQVSLSVPMPALRARPNG